MRLSILIAGLLVLYPLSVQARASLSRTGVYDSVHIHDETGDLLGTWVEVTDGPAPTARFQFCEGDCSNPHSLPVKILGDRMTLQFPGPPDGPRVPVSGRFTAKGLWLKIGAEGEAQFLPRAKHSQGPH